MVRGRVRVRRVRFVVVVVGREEQLLPGFLSFRNSTFPLSIILFILYSLFISILGSSSTATGQEMYKIVLRYAE